MQNISKTKKITLIILTIALLLGVFILNQNQTTTDIVTENATTTENTQPTIQAESSYEYKINNEASTITWEGRKTLIPSWIDQGNIKLQESGLNIENDTLKNAKLVFDMNSITSSKTGSGSGFDRLTNHLKSPDFFDVATYPTATLMINKFENDLFTGELTIKGVTQPISFKAETSKEGEIYKAKGEIIVDRTKYNVRYGSDSFFDNLGNNVIDNNFTIRFDLTASK